MLNKLQISLSGLLVTAMPLAQAGELNLYSMNTGSYIYHMTGNHERYNGYLNSNLFPAERKFPQDSEYSVLIGTMKNSLDGRCLTFDVRRDWLKNDTGWMLKGVYAYTGEFFFDTFSHCRNSGTYHTAKKVTGVGPPPYLYHGLQYNFTDYFGVEGGIIMPVIFVMSIQWNSRQPPCYPGREQAVSGGLLLMTWRQGLMEAETDRI